MNKIHHPSLLSTAVLALMLSGCGSGSSGGGNKPEPTEPPTPEPPPSFVLSGSAVKGPLANALVEAYAVDYTAADLRGELISSGETDSAARFVGLELEAEQAPFVIVVSADDDTVDLTTGEAPVITSLQTLITADQLEGETPIYATPLTSIALSVAAKKGTSAETLDQSLQTAQNQVKSTLGFGMDGDIDIFTVPPVLTDSTTSAQDQQQVAEYRLAVEAVSAVLNDIAGKTTAEDDNADTLLDAIATDLTDGSIDGSADGVAIEAFHGTVVADEIQQDPANLTIPGTETSVAAIEQVLSDETADTGTSTELDPTVEVEGEPAQTDADSDLDGVPDTQDAFPQDPSEVADTDQDGTGDNRDAFPEDPSEDTDTDNDGTGDNSDAFPEDPEENTDTDGDGIGDNGDAFPEDPEESSDSDEDGIGDNSDLFPENPAESVDSDEDGTGDNGDNCPQTANEDQADSDSDGIGDVCDTVDGPNQTTWDESQWDDGSTWQ